MKKLNFTLLLGVVLSFMACESTDATELENPIPLVTEIEIDPFDNPEPTDLCDLPELPETCPLESNEIGMVTAEADILNDFTLCLDEAWSDPDLAPFEYEGEVYSYIDAGENDPTAIVSLTAVTFHYITELDTAGTAKSDPGFATKFFRCAVEIIGINDIKKLLKHYRNGRLTKKMLWRIIKRNAIRKFGWVGAAISFCEFLACMAK